MLSLTASSGSAYEPADPTVANPATEGYSESDLVTMDEFSAMEYTPEIGGYPGLPVIPDSYGENSAGEGFGVPVWYGSAEARTRMTTKDGTRRYVRRNKKGQFTSYQVNVDGKKGAIANDRRAKAKNYAKPGFRNEGDAKPVSQADRR